MVGKQRAKSKHLGMEQCFHLRRSLCSACSCGCPCAAACSVCVPLPRLSLAQILHHSLGKPGALDFEMQIYKEVREEGQPGHYRLYP